MTATLPGRTADEVELFAGIEQRKLEVKLIPRDDMQCRLLISNKTDKPLSVKLPDSFAGVPVLAQVGAMGGNSGAGQQRRSGGERSTAPSAARRPPMGRPAPL